MKFNDFLSKYQKKKVSQYTNAIFEKPLVSINVVTYQHVNFIKECLDGILMQQTDFTYEILLGEDDSTDGTREVCIEYAKRYPEKIRLFLHHRENNIIINGNPTGRFNFLYNLYNARGKYIALCEGDDYWTDPLKLQKQVNFLEKNTTYSLCFHNVNIFNKRNGENKTYPIHKNLDRDSFETNDIIKEWFIPTASIVYRNYKDFEFPEWFQNCASGDIPLLLLLSVKGKFKYINENMGCYRLHDSGISTTHNGYYKVFSMIYIYQNFDIYTNYKFHEKINEAMIYEVRRHLPEIEELKELKVLLKNLKKKNLTFKKKVKRKIKTIFGLK